MTAWILLIAYIIVVIATIINLLISGARPTKTLGWILLILALPILGIVFYLTFGRNRRKNKFFKIKKTKQIQEYINKANQFYNDIEKGKKFSDKDLQENIKLAKLIIKSSIFLPMPGNTVQVLQNGPDTFDAIFEAMEKAESFIHVQYYIYEDGDLADRFLEIFEKKVKEGVEVRLIYDGVGSVSLSKSYINKLKELDCSSHCFLPLRFGKITTHINYRNHRKIIIVDGKVGFTGGINVSDKYIKGDPALGTWHDTHIRIEGSGVDSLHAVFAMDWYFVSQEDKLLNKRYFPQYKTDGESIVQIVSSGPDSDFSSVRQQYFTQINQAEEYVYITNSYVIPDSPILEALQTAALSGVDVRILIPLNSDSSLVKWSIRSYFEELLKAGVRIYLYPDGFLHAKTMVTDDMVSSVGTANMDIRSFEQNFEVNAVVYDTVVAKQLKKDFLKDLKISKELNLETFQERSQWERLKEGAAKVFSPVL